MQNINPAHNLPWTCETVAPDVAERLIAADQAARASAYLASQALCLFDENNSEVDQVLLALKVCSQHACDQMAAASYASMRGR